MNQSSWGELKKWLVEHKAIDETIDSPESIKRLDLSNLSLTQLPDEIGLLQDLIALNLSNNQLQTLPSSMTSMKNLSNIDLRRNHLNAIPQLLSSLPIRSLNCSSNMIDDVTVLAHMQDLRVVDLSVNAITTLEHSLRENNDIRVLNLSCNYLKNIKNLLTHLRNIERLDLSGNMINQIPATIANLENIVELKLGDNIIEHLDDALFDLELQSLDLSSNRLYILELKGLQELESITLDFNPIKHIEASRDFAPYLESFSVDGCGVKKWVTLESKELHEICYSSNELTEIPEEIGLYGKLEELDLDENNITELPDNMANLTLLNTLYIDGNPLTPKAKKIIEILHPEICDIHMKRGITIENALEEDLVQMAQLLSILFAIEQDFEINYDKQLAGVTKLYHSQGKELLVAKHEGLVVGMVTMQRLISSAESDYIGQIEDLVVKEEYRKMGVGSRLINKMRVIAQEYGYKRIQLAADEANSNALHFYSRRGFHQTHLKMYHYKAFL